MSPRNKKNVFVELFKTLREYVSRDIDYELHQALYVNTSDQEDDLIENSNVISYHFSSDAKIYLMLEHEGKKYYCFTREQVDSYKINSDNFVEEDLLTKGIWTLIQSQYIRCCRSDASASCIYDEILYVDSGEPPTKAKSVDINMLYKYFNKLNIFRIVDGSHYDSDDIYKIKGYFDVTLNHCTLPFSETTVNNYTSLFSSGLKSIPMDLIHLSFSSNQYKQSFLELYRCIEQLYPVPALRELLGTGSIKTSCPLEVAALFEDKINWRPRESEAIGMVFKDLDFLSTSKIDAVKQGTEYSSLSGSLFIYKLRNANVHFRKKLGKGELTNAKWEELIDAMLDVILDLYNKYDGNIA